MRKKGLSRLVGLATEKERARIDIIACRRLGEPFPHTLLHGVGGTGKTAFARAIAEELEYFFFEKEAASLRSREDIVELLNETCMKAKRAARPLCLFIDEVHRLTERQQEVFYFPMTEWRVDAGDDHWVPLAPFTLIAATTKRTYLDQASFVRRFTNVWEISPYGLDEMLLIVACMFDEERIAYSYEHLRRIAAVCSGIPRTAKGLVFKIRNQAVVRGSRQLISDDISRAFVLHGVMEG